MKRKLTACVLTAVMAVSLAAPALAAEDDIMKNELPSAVQTEGERQVMKHSELYYGQIAEIGTDEEGNVKRLVMKSQIYGDYIMNITGKTVWVDSGNKTSSAPSELKVGEGVYVFHSPVSTRSLPPQTEAYAIVRNIPQDASSTHYQVIEKVEKQADGSVRLVTDQGGLYITADSKTGLSAYDSNEKLQLSALKAGDRVMVWYDVVLETYPAQAYAQHIMRLPAYGGEENATQHKELAEGTKLTMELDGKVPNMVGRYENGTAMVPVAAVAQALGFHVTYTPKGHSALVTVESDDFQVRLDIGNPNVIGVTKMPDAVGMTAPQNYGKAPYIVAPGTTWAPAELFEMLGKTVTLDGSNLIIK